MQKGCPDALPFLQHLGKWTQIHTTEAEIETHLRPKQEHTSAMYSLLLTGFYFKFERRTASDSYDSQSALISNRDTMELHMSQDH